MVYKDFDETLKKTMEKLSQSENHSSPRGLKTKELINYSVCINNPRLTILTNPHRKLSIEYLKAEFDWYLSGELNIDKIKQHASMWEKIKNPDGTVNSNYGYFVFHQKFNYDNQLINQFQYCFDCLLNDIDSRQAVINFNQLHHKYKNNKDFVCTLSLQFLIRNNQLHSIVNMRSCDIVYGASYDIPWFSYIQLLLLEKLTKSGLNISLGQLYHNSASLHIYEKHFNMMNNIILDDNQYDSEDLTAIIKKEFVQ